MKKYDLAQSSPYKDDRIKFINFIKKIANTEIKPLVSEMDESACINKDLVKSLFQAKIMGIEIPNKYGGLGLSFEHTILAIEEISKIDPAISVFIDVHNTLVNSAICKWGSDEQKQTYLPQLAQNKVGAFSLTERHAGSDAYSLSTSAVKHNEGYIINGSKHLITNASEADIFIVFANVKAEGKNERLTAFVIDDLKDVEISTPVNKMGIRASSTCSINLNNVFIPQKNILGKEGSGKRIVLEILTDGRIGIASQMLGLSEGALLASMKYAQKREQFGKPIATYQAVSFELARMATQIESLRAMLDRVINVRASDNFMEYFKLASMAKLHSSEVAEYVSTKAVEIFGGEGYLKTSPVEKFYRDAKIGAIYEGTSNILLKTIAKLILKVKNID